MHRVRIWHMPKDEERCAPSEPCLNKHQCLRFRANPDRGTPLADHSTGITADLGCISFLPLPENDEAP